MRRSDGGNVPGMARRCEPVMDCGPDRAAADGRLSRALVTRDEQEDAISALYRLVESVIDCAPCSVEGHAVQVDGAVRLESTVAEPTVPCAIESRARFALFRTRRRPGERAHRYDLRRNRSL